MVIGKVPENKKITANKTTNTPKPKIKKEVYGRKVSKLVNKYDNKIKALSDETKKGLNPRANFEKEVEKTGKEVRINQALAESRESGADKSIAETQNMREKNTKSKSVTDIAKRYDNSVLKKSNQSKKFTEIHKQHSLDDKQSQSKGGMSR